MAKIVIIDDDRQLLDLMSMTLGRAGHEVVTMNRPHEGLVLLREDKPDLLILDVMMPGMSGHEVCRTVKADPLLADLPVLILTARGQTMDRRAALDSGADAYLSKPVTNKELLERVDQLLGARAAAVEPEQLGVLIAVFGLRGGVGRTTLAVNLAVALRAISNQRVALVDFSPAGGQATVHLRLRPPLKWSEFPAGSPLESATLHGALMEHESGLQLLAAPNGPVAASEPPAALAEQIVDLLHREMLFTVIDLPGVLTPAAEVTLRKADLILHVVTPEFIAVRLASYSQRLLDDDAYHRAQQAIILNQVTPQAQIPRAAVEQALSGRVAFEIGYDAEQAAALARGQLLPLAPAATPLPAGVRQLAAALWQRAQETGLVTAGA